MWSDKNWQDDLAWYDAVKQGDSYVISQNLSKHRYNTGKYYFDTYVKDNAGNMQCISSETATYSAGKSDIAISEVTANEKYNVSVSDVSVPGGIKNIKVAAWSDANGQDDVVWYTASKSGSTYTATIDLLKHLGFGKYYIDVYAENSVGTMIYINGTTHTFSFNENISITGKNINSTKTATFRTGKNYSKVQFAVWSNIGGQDDLVWYNASKVSNGTWSCVLKYSNHRTEGIYNLHVYADGKAVLGTTFAFMSSDSFDIGYLSLAVDIANDESHGYTLNVGYDKDYDGSGDFDCASYVSYCLIHSGYYPGASDLPCETMDMREALTDPDVGFVAKPFSYQEFFNGSIILNVGDILLYENPTGGYGHVEFYIGNGQTIGAHSDANLNPTPGDQTGLEISIYTLANNYNSYNYYLRDPNLADKL